MNACLRSLMSLALLALGASAASAQYAPRYSATTRGALTFTGNAQGLSSDGGSLPGTVGSIGAFISLDPGFAAPGGWPAATTMTWQANGSSAELRLPPGATVEHAELVWGGHFDDLPGDVGAAVTLVAPDGDTTTVSPGSGVSRADTSKDFYANAVDVTSAVAAGGAGTWAVLGVPASLTCTSNCNLRSAGWTLAVAYAHPELPLRNLSLWSGLEPGGADPASLDGICTPSAGEVRARVLVSALEGDAQGYGDNLAFGPAGGSLTSLSGPNNGIGNFFAAQINGDDGELDVSGSFGDWNLGDGDTGRHGWDITNVDGTGILPPGTTAAAARGITSNEQYRVTAMGLQVDTGQPIFEAPTSVASASSTALVPGEVVTLSWTWRNDGAETAVAPRFLLELPDGLAFVESSMFLDGEDWTSADPTLPPGKTLGDLAPGESHEVTVDVQHVGGVDALIASATLDYSYTTCGDLEGDGLVRVTAPAIAVARVEASLDALPVGHVSPGQEITLSLSLANVGAAPTEDATLALTLPEGLDFVADSLVIDGVLRPGAALPSGPFALDTQAAAPGVLPAGGLVTVSYNAIVAPAPAPVTLTVTAAFDDSSSVGGAPPPATATVAVTVCGDGVAGGLEACDDGAANSDVTADRCRTDCTAHRCGDGVQDSGEACDPGAELETSCAYGEQSCEVCGGGCAWVPGAASWCGDGELDEGAGEVCDDGADNSDVAPDACRTTCLAPECGDGVQDSGEACDDSNDIDDDTCSDLGQAQLCGNGQLDEGEACDDGPGASPPCAYGDAECQRCDDACQIIPDAARWCGDGHLDLDEGEACDDGNNLLELCRYGEVACAVCGPSCQPTAGTPTWCGDGSIDGVHGEVCDDGNTEDGDGCSSTCQPDVVASQVDDGCVGGRSGSASWALLALLLLLWRRYGPTLDERASSFSRRSQPTGSSAAQARR